MFPSSGLKLRVLGLKEGKGEGVDQSRTRNEEEFCSVIWAANRRMPHLTYLRSVRVQNTTGGEVGR